MGKLGMKYMSKALLLFVLLLMTDRGVGYGLKWMYFNQKGEDFYYTTKALDKQTADLVYWGHLVLVIIIIQRYYRTRWA